MTGRYPARLGVTDWIRSRFQGGAIPADKKNPSAYINPEGRALSVPENALWMEQEEITIAELLKPAGYTTCHIGKWHLGADEWYPQQQGFDFNYGGCDYGQPPSYFDPYSQPDHRHEMIRAGIPNLPSRKPGEYLTDREADEAVSFIQQHKDQPFFLYLAHYAVHTPIQAKSSVSAKYESKTGAHSGTADYAAMVESVDDAMGRLLATLEELDLRENTLIIFTSDNGGLDREGNPTDNAPLRSGKGYPYEGGIRVPLLVSWPGSIPAQKLSERLVSSVDYLPTLSELTNQPVLEGRSIDGTSLLTHLQSGGQAEQQREALYWHFPHYRGKDVIPYSIIREGPWKMIKRYEGPTYELYNLEADLGEQEDLAEQMPEQVEHLNAKLKQWLENVGAKMPKPVSVAN
jgi:arylsulfatase A-like enzyme